MKRLILILATIGMIMTACQGGFDIDDNGGNKTEQPDSGGSNNGDNAESSIFT